jgi:hypothetical protein
MEPVPANDDDKERDQDPSRAAEVQSNVHTVGTLLSVAQWRS